jgi:hypothetical protein
MTKPLDYTYHPTIERGRSRTGGLEKITLKEIQAILGPKIKPIVGSGDGKVRREWCFRVKVGRLFLDGHFAIWDYRDHRALSKVDSWSTYGNHDTLEKIFGDKYKRG